jgi:hypothetical protein
VLLRRELRSNKSVQQQTTAQKLKLIIKSVGMESICYGVGGIFDDSRSVSSLTTVLVSNRSKVTPETCSAAEVPHQEDEKDVDTIDSDPSHEVAGSHHRSIFSDLTASDDSEALDPDLQAEMEQLEQSKEKIKKKQRKRNLERAKQAEHEDQKKPTKKRRDDEDDKDGNEGGAVSAK